jgi:hypothetical protein
MDCLPHTRRSWIGETNTGTTGGYAYAGNTGGNAYAGCTCGNVYTATVNASSLPRYKTPQRRPNTNE